MKIIDGFSMIRIYRKYKVISIMSGLIFFVFFKTLYLSNANLINNSTSFKERDPTWTWVCEKESCVKKEILDLTTNPVSLPTCEMTCFNEPIWPKPVYLTLGSKSYSKFDKTKTTISVMAPKKSTEILKEYLQVFKRYFNNEGNSVSTYLNIKILIRDTRDITKLSSEIDESYSLKISLKNDTDEINVLVISETFYGARHGLETLSQVTWYDDVYSTWNILNSVSIKDFPKFTYRGVMIDTARNYFPLNLIKKAVDGMSYNKLNTLHLHLTDSVSFPIELPNLPEMAQRGAYSKTMIYKAKDIKELVSFANIRGVRVILEVDAPSHVSSGWNHDQNNRQVICDDDDVMNGHLNPDNNESLNTLEKIYKDLLDLSDQDEYFHVGGDEVNLTCWEDTKAAQNFYDMTKFWANFTNAMFDKLKLANGNKLPKNIIMWSSDLTDSNLSLDLLNHKKNLIVQYWFGNINSIVNMGFRVIFSTVGHWYLDCGFGPWKPSQKAGSCDPFTPWQKFYSYRPWEAYRTVHVEGGEVALWSEEVAEESLETRIWPRSAAFAERVWSDPPRSDLFSVYRRLDQQRNRMRKRGLEVSAIWPKWCSQNPGKCV